MLTAGERKHLRGLAQTLEMAVAIGKQGLTDGMIGELESALTRSGLIKVRLPGDREAREALAAEVASRTRSAHISTVGSSAAFYRPIAE